MLFEELLREAREEGREEGRVLGKMEVVLELLRELGPVPEELSARIRSETDGKQLNIWLREAARAKSIEQFMERLPKL